MKRLIVDLRNVETADDGNTTYYGGTYLVGGVEKQAWGNDRSDCFETSGEVAAEIERQIEVNPQELGPGRFEPGQVYEIVLGGNPHVPVDIREIDPNKTEKRDAKYDALKVLTSDEKIRDFIQKNDPKALRQAEDALVQEDLYQSRLENAAGLLKLAYERGQESGSVDWQDLDDAHAIALEAINSDYERPLVRLAEILELWARVDVDQHPGSMRISAEDHYFYKAAQLLRKVDKGEVVVGDADANKSVNHYRITLEFDTYQKLSKELMDELTSVCSVQLESLEDGDLDNLDEEVSYHNANANWTEE